MNPGDLIRETLRVYIRNIGETVVYVSEIQVVDLDTGSTICFCRSTSDCYYQEYPTEYGMKIKPGETKYIEFRWYH